MARRVHLVIKVTMYWTPIFRAMCTSTFRIKSASAFGAVVIFVMLLLFFFLGSERKYLSDVLFQRSIRGIDPACTPVACAYSYMGNFQLPKRSYSCFCRSFGRSIIWSYHGCLLRFNREIDNEPKLCVCVCTDGQNTLRPMQQQSARRLLCHHGL